MLQEILYEYRRRELEKHRRETDVYWITDLCRCPMKRIYELRYPEILLQDIFSPNFILGDVLHIGLEELLKRSSEEGLIDYDVEAEVEKERRINVDGKEIVIRGRLDLLLKKNKELIGIEIKSSRSDSGIPHEHHILQCRLYSWLFELSKVILIYITPDRIAEYEITEGATEEMVVNLIKDSKAPRWSWECRYCRFSVMCPYKK
ncbi:MAG: CRISPR-associated protein Cas4 [Thermoprotei archaeon]|nr:MAG: CRISPR-associated protein Cas4 [Thermoprotei archaeon]RLF20623.1 MAG: CRISPR-associated protein Cas4 [Thermoprotei archaeon]